MKKEKSALAVLLLVLLIGSFMSCKKKENTITNPPDQNDSELITTFKLSFVDSAGIDPNMEFLFRDIDGPGGNAPSDFDTLILGSDKTYFVTLTLLNESVSPSIDITSEILAEANEHLFCFNPTIGGDLSITRTDTDGTYELGITSKWRTLSTSDGLVLIKLKHQPGIKNGQCEPGETDVELEFQTKIQ